MRCESNLFLCVRAHPRLQRCQPSQAPSGRCNRLAQSIPYRTRADDETDHESLPRSAPACPGCWRSDIELPGIVQSLHPSREYSRESRRSIWASSTEFVACWEGNQGLETLRCPMERRPDTDPG